MESEWLLWLGSNLPWILTACASAVAAFYSSMSHRKLISAMQPTLLVSPVPGSSPVPGAAPSPASLLPAGPSSSTALPAGGGGSVPGMLPLAALPAWSEQHVLGIDGNPAPDHNGLCGEVCVAAVVAAVHGVPTDPSDHRVYLHGSGGSPLTTADDLMSLLHHCSVAATGHICDWADAHTLMTARLAEGCYSILLIAPDWVNGVLHWVVPVSSHGDSIYVMDTWDGILRVVTLAQLGVWYGGQIVTTSARPHYDARGWSMPPN